MGTEQLMDKLWQQKLYVSGHLDRRKLDLKVTRVVAVVASVGACLVAPMIVSSDPFRMAFVVFLAVAIIMGFRSMLLEDQVQLVSDDDQAFLGEELPESCRRYVDAVRANGRERLTQYEVTRLYAASHRSGRSRPGLFPHIGVF